MHSYMNSYYTGIQLYMYSIVFIFDLNLYIPQCLYIPYYRITCIYTYRILKYVYYTHRNMFALSVIYRKSNE